MENKKNVLLAGHLKEKLNFDVDDLCKLPADDLRWQVDYAISQVCEISKSLLKISRGFDRILIRNQRIFKIVKKLNIFSLNP